MTYYMPKLLTETVSAVENIDSITSVGEMTNGVTGIAKAISDYGPVIVLMSIFFVIFIALVVLVLRSNSKMMNQIINSKSKNDEMEQEIISKMLQSALEEQNEKNHIDTESILDEINKSLKALTGEKKEEKKESDDYHKDLVGAYIDVNMAFKDASREALNKLKCERIAIYVFHNGNNSLHGFPFFKMSCIHEWTSHGSNTLRGKFHSDMPLHMFDDFINDLWKDKVYKAADIEEVAKIDPSILEFTSYSSTKALYMIAIVDSNDTLAGFIVSEFSNPDTFDKDSVRDRFIYNILSEMRTKVSPIIVNKYVFKNRTENK